MDSHSSCPEVMEMPRTTATGIIAVFQALFASYGLPEQTVSDKGPQFTANEVVGSSQQNVIGHIRSGHTILA